MILGISILLWAATSFPKPSSYLIDSRVTAGEAVAATDVAAARAAEELEFSVAGRAGRFLEPAFAPLGFDWKMVTAMIGAFAAKEVCVAQMDRLPIADPEEGARGPRPPVARRLLTSRRRQPDSLPPHLRLLHGDDRRDEARVGPLALGALQLFGLTAIAWLVSFLVYQGGRLCRLKENRPL
ncbi:MAG: hypothetical protein IPN03_14940 [Holophagales bacterium]|nr:hypothetical protein [Holophagales bacterium]